VDSRHRIFVSNVAQNIAQKNACRPIKKQGTDLNEIVNKSSLFIDIFIICLGVLSGLRKHASQNV